MRNLLLCGCLAASKLFFLCDTCRLEETTSLEGEDVTNLLSVWIYCLLCILKSVAGELQSQLPKSHEAALQKPNPSPFPLLAAQHLLLGHFLTLEGLLSHCKLQCHITLADPNVGD